MFSKETLFVALFILVLLLPDNSTSYIVIGLSPILLFFSKKNNGSFGFDKNLLSFFIVITLSFIIAAVSGLESKSILRYFSFSVLFLLFPFTPSLVVPNRALYFTLSFIVVSQLAFAVGFTQVVSLIDNVYPYQGDTLGYDSEFLLGGAGDIDFITNRRYGGIYRNPNQAVRYISLLLIIFLLENKNDNLLKKIPFICIVFISIILAGSRTGLVVTLGIIVYSIYVHQSKFSVKKFTLGLALVSVFSLLYSFLSGFDLRMFEVSAGMDNSLALKFEVFNHFFKNLVSPVKFLFGHFSTENLLDIYQIEHLDSEWGELFYNFGLLGFITLFFFYRKMFLLKDPDIRFFMLILLWGISSTILFSFKMSFLFMMFLSKYYSDYIQTKLSYGSKSF